MRGIPDQMIDTSNRDTGGGILVIPHSVTHAFVVCLFGSQG